MDYYTVHSLVTVKEILAIIYREEKEAWGLGNVMFWINENVCNERGVK